MEFRRAFLISIAIHLGLALGLYNIYIAMTTVEKEFVDLTVGSISGLPSSMTWRVAEPASQLVSRVAVGPTPPIENLGEPITFPKPELLPLESLSLLLSGGPESPQLTVNEKSTFSFGNVDLPLGQDSAGLSEAYFIEGNARQRQVINRVIPTYPPNYQKEAIITLAFQILPAGLVTGVSVDRKGDPILEQVAIDAFKQWVFEPVAEKQGNQTGRISFVFKIK